MCGIAGWLYASGSEPPDNVLAQMSAALLHRGPDDSGTYRERESGIALEHRRLSIIDLTDASHQPMRMPEAELTLAYNGELYNFRDLRRELELLGHSFASLGDTEVVLKSFAQWGVACFARFAGMFAIALWDGRAKVLHLARDPMGMKPLYYLPQKSGVAFASEVKALKYLPSYRGTVADQSVRQYLEFGYVYDEHATMFDGVFKLPPGHHVALRADAPVKPHPFFTPPRCDETDVRGENARVSELAVAMEKVVAEHLIADVPVGLLLSGGLDSSVVAAIAARQGPLLTISMGFSDSTVDERPFARAVNEHIGSKHIEVLISPEQVMAEVQSGAWVFDDLFADWGTITTRLLYRRCREQGVKVVLVGEGADELFGGYDIFDQPRALNLWTTFRLYQRYAGRRYGRGYREFSRIMGEYAEACGGDAFAAVRLFESRRQLPNQYVMKVDKASMAESIEARAPYLDRRIAEIAYNTPREWLLRNGENKYLLRAMARSERLLPETVAQRPKFGAPLAADWMDNNARFRGFARERILGGKWVQRAGLAKAMALYFSGESQGYSAPHPLSIFRILAWRLLLLELWGTFTLPANAGIADGNASLLVSKV